MSAESLDRFGEDYGATSRQVMVSDAFWQPAVIPW